MNDVVWSDCFFFYMVALVILHFDELFLLSPSSSVAFEDCKSVFGSIQFTCPLGAALPTLPPSFKSSEDILK